MSAEWRVKLPAGRGKRSVLTGPHVPGAHTDIICQAASIESKIAAVEAAIAEARQNQVTLRLTRDSLKREVEEGVRSLYTGACSGS